MSAGRFRGAALQVVARLQRAGMSEQAGAALVEIIGATRDDAELVAEVYAAKARAQREALDWAERATRAESYAHDLEAKQREVWLVHVPLDAPEDPGCAAMPSRVRSVHCTLSGAERAAAQINRKEGRRGPDVLAFVDREEVLP